MIDIMLHLMVFAGLPLGVVAAMWSAMWVIDIRTNNEINRQRRPARIAQLERELGIGEPDEPAPQGTWSKLVRRLSRDEPTKPPPGPPNLIRR